jgi:hypothetical protein
MTFGCVANMDVDERCLLRAAAPAPGKTPVDGLEAAFALGAVASPHLAGTRPLRWAAIHFGERNRNARGNDYRAAWEQVLWPLVGAFQVLSEDGLPVGIVNDRQLDRTELDDYRLLVLPNPYELRPSQQQAVGAFRARGGAVLENDPAWEWSDPATRSAAAAAFRAALRPGLETAPIRVTGGPANLYAVSYCRERRLVVALTNDFSWVQISSRDDVPAAVNQPAPPATGVEVTWRTGRGLPQIPRPWPGFQRFRAVEAISGATLEVERLGDGHRVRLPPFPFMALLVVTPVSRWPQLLPVRR